MSSTNFVTEIPLDALFELTVQKQVKAMEFQRNAKRRALFDAKGEIDRQRGRLISEIVDP